MSVSLLFLSVPVPLLPGVPTWALAPQDHNQVLKPALPVVHLPRWGDHSSSDPGSAPPPSLPAPPRSACTSCPTSPRWTSSTSSPNTSAAPRASLMRMVAAAPRQCGPARGASGGPAFPNSKLVVWGLVHCETSVPAKKQGTGQDGLLSLQPGALPLLL